MITKADRNPKGQSESIAEAWRIAEDEIIKGSAGSVTYTEQDIVDLPIDMLTDEEPTIEQVRGILKGKVLASELTAEEVAAITDLSPAWQDGLVVTQNDVDLQNIFSYSGILYRPVSAHTTQSDWTPDITDSLWTEAVPAGVIAEWVQPEGAHDAYQIGDKVSHNGWIWECTADDAGGNNSWEPGVYGWTQIEPA